MDIETLHRAINQNLETDSLLGVDFAPKAGRIFEAEEAVSRPTADRIEARPIGATQRVARSTNVSGSTAVVSRFEVFAEPGVADKPAAIQRLSQAGPYGLHTQGNANASLLFILDSPPNQRADQTAPFSGRHGQLLEKQMQAMKLSNTDYFITHIVKPTTLRQPSAEQIQLLGNALLSQICIVRPSVVVTLGGAMTNILLGTQKAITTLRGNWQDLTGYEGLGEVSVMPTFHPAYLLKAYTVENRKKVWNDLKMAIDKLG